ncbi:MAG: hypothetical protein Q9212_006810 [Teloschistes hypoglaucus]
MFPDANAVPDLVQGSANVLPPSNSQNLQQFSELSPPTSQDPADSRTLGSDPMDYANGAEQSITPALFASEGPANSSHPDLSVADCEPGASWQNLKQQDDEDRVREQVLDRAFSMREFGDFYDEKDRSDEV